MSDGDAILGHWQLVEVEYVPENDGYDDWVEDDEGDDDESEAADIYSAEDLGLDDAYLHVNEDGTWEGVYWESEEEGGAWRVARGRHYLERGHESVLVTLSEDGDILTRHDFDEEQNQKILVHYQRA